MWILHRLAADFWPADRSSIAPNLLASLICLVTGYLAGGRRAWRNLHRKLDAHHDAQMHAHQITHTAVTGDRKDIP